MVNYPHKISSQKRQAPLSQTKKFRKSGNVFWKDDQCYEWLLFVAWVSCYSQETDSHPNRTCRLSPTKSSQDRWSPTFRQASTTDYSGVYDGYYIDFEAKETRQNMRYRWRIFIPIRSSIWNKSLPSKESALYSFTFLLSKKPTYYRLLTSSVSIIKIRDRSQCHLDIFEKMDIGLSLVPFHRFPYLEVIKEHY